jgi:hypothetical protein
MTETRRASMEVETPNRTPSMAVIEAVADARGVDPLQLEPLANAIDPEALDRFFAHTYGGRPRAVGRLTFEVAGCEVTVTGADEVSVTSRVIGEGPSRAGER